MNIPTQNHTQAAAAAAAAAIPLQLQLTSQKRKKKKDFLATETPTKKKKKKKTIHSLISFFAMKTKLFISLYSKKKVTLKSPSQVHRRPKIISPLYESNQAKNKQKKRTAPKTMHVCPLLSSPDLLLYPPNAACASLHLEPPAPSEATQTAHASTTFVKQPSVAPITAYEIAPATNPTTYP
jgi:hypothetical protein